MLAPDKPILEGSASGWFWQGLGISKPGAVAGDRGTDPPDGVVDAGGGGSQAEPDLGQVSDEAGSGKPVRRHLGGPKPQRADCKGFDSPLALDEPPAGAFPGRSAQSRRCRPEGEKANSRRSPDPERDRDRRLLPGLLLQGRMGSHLWVAAGQGRSDEGRTSG